MKARALLNHDGSSNLSRRACHRMVGPLVFVTRGPDVTEPIVPPTPDDWGADSLGAFIDTMRRNVFAGFVRLPRAYQRLARIDTGLRLIGENLNNAEDWFVCLFLLRTHSSYLGAAHLALGGQLPESYMLQRGCLENAVYAFYFHRTPDSHERWLRRHDSPRTKKVAEEEFRIRALLRLLRAHDEKLGTVAARLYERTIDYGGHPNERAVTQMLILNRAERTRHFNLHYLTGHTRDGSASSQRCRWACAA
jgi:hypothetical protein